MNADELAVQRALWATKLKVALAKAGMTVTEYFTDYSNNLGVRHEAAPGWRAVLAVNSSRAKRNRLELGGKLLASTVNARTMPQIVDAVLRHRQLYAVNVAQASETEQAAAAWQQRQETEIGSEPMVDWMDANIITNGVHKGRYRISFEPGCPLEHLDIEHVKALIQICARIGS